MARDHARPTRRERNGVLYELVELPKRVQQDLVDRDALGRRDRVDDQRRDVLDGEDLGSARYSASILPRLRVRDVLRQLGRDGAGLNADHAHVVLEQLLPQRPTSQ